VNALTEAFRSTKEAAQMEQMELLLLASKADAHGAASKVSGALEQVIVRHVASALSVYKSELERLEVKHRQQREGLADELGEAVDSLYESMKSGLVEDLDKQLAAALPRPDLLPTTVAVEISRRRAGTETVLDVVNLAITGTSVPLEILLTAQQQVQHRLELKRDRITQLTRRDLFIHDKSSPLPPTLVPEDSVRRPLSAFVPAAERLGGASLALRVVFEFDLHSETERCFSVEFVEGAGMAMDYYRCETCNLNWVCRRCAEQCHPGHQIVTYVLNHTPTWACCYCAKKRKQTNCRLCSSSC
jgi:hypothetical protein